MSRPYRGSTVRRAKDHRFVQEQVSIEELDLMQDALRELEHLSKLATADLTKRFWQTLPPGQSYSIADHSRRTSATKHWRRTAGIDGQTRRHIDPDLLRQLALS